MPSGLHWQQVLLPSHLERMSRRDLGNIFFDLLLISEGILVDDKFNKLVVLLATFLVEVLLIMLRGK